MVAEVTFRRHEEPGKYGSYTACVIPAEGSRPYQRAESQGKTPGEALLRAVAYHSLLR